MRTFRLREGARHENTFEGQISRISLFVYNWRLIYILGEFTRFLLAYRVR